MRWFGCALAAAVALLHAAVDEGSDGLAVAGIRATLLERLRLMECVAVGVTG